MTETEQITETYDVVDGLPLRLSFSVQAIREHFGDGDDLTGLDDEALRTIASYALADDLLYRTFHDVLDAAIKDVRQSIIVHRSVIDPPD